MTTDIFRLGYPEPSYYTYSGITISLNNNIYGIANKGNILLINNYIVASIAISNISLSQS